MKKSRHQATKIAPDTVTNTPKFIVLATKIKKNSRQDGNQNSSGSIHPTIMYCAIL